MPAPPGMSPSSPLCSNPPTACPDPPTPRQPRQEVRRRLPCGGGAWGTEQEGDGRKRPAGAAAAGFAATGAEIAGGAGEGGGRGGGAGGRLELPAVEGGGVGAEEMGAKGRLVVLTALLLSSAVLNVGLLLLYLQG